MLARELPQEGTCDFVEMLPRSSEGTSWEGGACLREVPGQDAAFRHERHKDPEASRTRDSAPVCRVVRSLLRWSLRRVLMPVGSSGGGESGRRSRRLEPGCCAAKVRGFRKRVGSGSKSQGAPRRIDPVPPSGPPASPRNWVGSRVDKFLHACRGTIARRWFMAARRMHVTVASDPGPVGSTDSPIWTRKRLAVLLCRNQHRLACLWASLVRQLEISRVPRKSIPPPVDWGEVP